jgi:hypothetical protein
VAASGGCVTILAMSKTSTKQPGLDSRHRNQGMTPGLGAFEKISAVEGVYLSREMKRDVKAISGQQLSGAERTRLINSKYGKK